MPETGPILPQQIDSNQLRLALITYFNDNDLRDLCFELKVEYESLPGQGKAAKARDLVQQCERERRLPELATAVLHTRPNIPRHTILVNKQTGQSPFKGLLAFEEADQNIFFGRTAIIETLAQQLMGTPATHFLALVGASGSGKSSIIRAGLLPILRQQTGWPIYLITPTAHPLESTAVTLTQESESVTAVTTLMDDMQADPRSLHLYGRRLLAAAKTTHPNHPPKLLLVIDQFEELFTLCRDEAERQAFIDNLVTAVQPESSGSIVVVITLRADFYSQCLRYQSLHHLLEEQQKIAPAMTAADLRDAIEKPAVKANLTFEPGLVELILRDVGDEPGGLPLLSHALLETWRRREGSHLTLAGYTAVGGVRGAIAHTADAVYQEQLRPSEQAIARRLFLRLTELGEGTEDTRRRVRLEQLLPAADPQPVLAVLDILAAARLLTIEAESVQVAHEALIREWPTLRRWLDEDREWLRQHRQLSEDAEAWTAHQQEASFLYRGSRLAAVETWPEQHSNELTPLEQKFLQASLAERARLAAEKVAQQRQEEQLIMERQTAVRLRRLSIALGVVFFLALLAALFALGQRQQAQASLRVAQTAEADANRQTGERATAEALANERANALATAEALALTQAAAESQARGTAVAAQATTAALSQQLKVQQLTNLAQISEEADLKILLAIEAIGAMGGLADGVPLAAYQAILDGLSDTRSLPQFTPRYETSNGGTAGLNRMGPLAVGADGRTLYGYSHIIGVHRWQICPEQAGGLCAAAEGDGVFGEAVVEAALSDQSRVFSANGGWLAATADDEAVARIWQLPTEEATAVLATTLNLADVADVVLSLSDDGRWLVVKSGTALQLWDAEQGVLAGQLTAEDATLAAGVGLTAAVSADGRWLAALFQEPGNSEQALILSEIGEAGLLPETQIATTVDSGVGILQFSPNGQWLSVGLMVFDLEALWEQGTAVSPIILSGHSNRIESVRFSPTGDYMLTTSTGQSSGGQQFQVKALLWDTLSPDLQAASLPHRDYSDNNASITVWDGAFSADGRWLATVSSASGATISIWPLQLEEIMRQGCQAVGRSFSEAEWQRYFPNEPYRQTCT